MSIQTNVVQLTKTQMTKFKSDIDAALAKREEDEKLATGASIILGVIGIFTGGITIGIASVLLGSASAVCDTIEDSMQGVGRTVNDIVSWVNSYDNFKNVQLEISYDTTSVQNSVYKYPVSVSLTGVQDLKGNWITKN